MLLDQAIDPVLATGFAAAGLLLGCLLVWLSAVRGKAEQSSALTQSLEEARSLLDTARSDLSAAAAREEALRQERGALLEERTELRTRTEDLRHELTDRRVELENLQTTLAAERRAHEERRAELQNVHNQIENELKLKMAELLDSSSAKFLDRAKEVLTAQHEKGETGIKTTVQPLKDALSQFQKQVAEMEVQRKRDEGELTQQIKQISESHLRLNDTTNSLVNALRSAPKTRGRWGEQQLRTLLELAGMAEYVDFETEKHFATEGGALRPDVILKMPGERTLVVDAKTSLSAYLEAMEAETEEQREAKLVEHAKQIRTHVDQLGRKEYWKALPVGSVDFVVMFVPGEPMYAAAMARDPSLFEDAWDKKVIVCSPTTLLGLAKAIAYGWRQEKASKEAQKIHEVAIELYRRMVKLGDDVSGMTKSLQGHVNKHNKFVASLESRVLPQARKMTDLSVGEAGEIATLEPIEQDVRAPLPGKDLEFDEDAPLQIEEAAE